MKEAASKQPKSGPVQVDLSEPAVHQLWDTVMRVVNLAAEKMLPFLKRFGIEEGNGLSLSPFATKIESVGQLLQLFTGYFDPPKRDCRGLTGVCSADADDENSEEIEECDAEDGNVCVDDTQLSLLALDGLLNDISAAEATAGTDEDDGDDALIAIDDGDNEKESAAVVECMFDRADKSNWFGMKLACRS